MSFKTPDCWNPFFFLSFFALLYVASAGGRLPSLTILPPNLEIMPPGDSVTFGSDLDKPPTELNGGHRGPFYNLPTPVASISGSWATRPTIKPLRSYRPINGTYYVLASTNLTLLLVHWTRVATNTYDGGGNFGFTNSLLPDSRQMFYCCSSLEPCWRV